MNFSKWELFSGSPGSYSTISEGDKTDDMKKREETLLSQLMMLVKQRDQLVQIEDTQIQQR